MSYKFQILNSKFQTNSKISKSQKETLKFLNLEFVWNLVLGIWNFIFLVVGVGISLSAHASTALPAGALVKASGSAVYAIGGDGRRYAFPNERIYKTWFKDFSGVRKISDDDLAAIDLGGNVAYKPGVRLVKLTTDPKVYAVGSKRVLRWVGSEASAREIYGTSWAKAVDDLSDAFFVDYDIGAPIISKTDYDPSWPVYANALIDSVIGGPGSDDPSRLPRDIPRYPASGFSFVGVSLTGSDVSAELDVADAADAVERWYEAMAPKLGWVRRESLAESVLGRKNGIMNVSFRKTDGAMTYDFTVTMLKAGTITLYRTPTTPDAGFEGFPASVPAYRGGELIYSKANAASSTAEYFVLTSAKPVEAEETISPDIAKASWRLVASEDVGTAYIRKYERMEGDTVVQLLVVIGEVTGVERNATAIIVRYGPMTTISAVNLDELKKIFDK
jgi:hypothetical protein